MINLNPSQTRARSSAASDAADAYFCADKQTGRWQWHLEDVAGTLLGGPFATFDELLAWAVEKEFVEPKIFRPILDEHAI
jgi:hypothetical protein